EARLCERILFRVGREDGGAAEDGVRERPRNRAFDRFADLAEEDRDQLLEPPRLAADLGVGEGGRGQEGLDRLQEAPLEVAQIALDGGLAGEDSGGTVGKEEDAA